MAPTVTEEGSQDQGKSEIEERENQDQLHFLNPFLSIFIMLFQGCLQIRNREKCLLLSSPKTTCHPSLCQFNAPPPNTEEFFSAGRTIAPTTPTLVHNLEGHLYGARATKTSLESRGGRYPSARVSKSFKVTELSLTCNYFIFIKCSI